jgi:cell division inhibitor SulA
MLKFREDWLNSPAIRRGSHAPAALPAGLPTGFSELDRCLPGAGWPAACLTELLPDQLGIGELSLLMPALARLSQERRWIAWIAPPHVPYAPALNAAGVDLSRQLVVHARDGLETHWAVEQALASGTCSAVLTWLGERVQDKVLRRLQLAAESGRTRAFVFRPSAAVDTSSPAHLRLSLSTAGREALRLRVLKCRGLSGAEIDLDLTHVMAESAFAAAGSGCGPASRRRH